uniref:Uncharacterized protein n=1 Tax=Anguilla anguilla TaxID=7936 RepID=A0A0E9S4T2_ANGAN
MRKTESRTFLLLA